MSKIAFVLLIAFILAAAGVVIWLLSQPRVSLFACDRPEFGPPLTASEESIVKNFHASASAAEAGAGNAGFSARVEAIVSKAYDPSNPVQLTEMKRVRIKSSCIQHEIQFGSTLFFMAEKKQLIFENWENEQIAIEKEIESAARQVEILRVCIANTSGKVQEETIRTISERGGARASGPGLSGGRRTARSDVCISVPEGMILESSPQIKRISCHGNRCANGSVRQEFVDGYVKHCVRVEAWSESGSGGGGGSYQIELSARAGIPHTEATARNVCLASLPPPAL